MLLLHFEAGEDEQLLKQLIYRQLDSENEAGSASLKPVLDNSFQTIRQQIQLPHNSRPLYSRLRYAAAAAVIIVAGTASWFLFNRKPGEETRQLSVQQQTPQNDVTPGGNKATLTLADGSVIVLDSATNGAIASEGGTKIIKLENGQLAYNAGGPGNGGPGNSGTATPYNTISTPRGGQYHIVLPDGSSVWLNAASSLRFPVAFTGKERRVEITGEAYFEISANASAPFFVKAGDIDVQVLGTSFNINAYYDEGSIKTTLLSGSVKVSNEASNAVLRPGQQAILNSRSGPEGKITLKTIDTEDAIAWKNGLFLFNNTDIKSIMRQIARWYDVEVKYEGNIPENSFVGEVSRDSRLSEVLKILELSNVHFKIEGKTITLMP